ncbi:hypothetical protein AWW67_11730 [Roseivirga seohaensis]|uniref:Antitoxin Xre/MbcA/ParS-like toxin-binding domain-containing protein n=1 Tax=Roseivirga seohaensis TaxID=1914963 RepID=A0A150XMK0_9BACT|nr:antitoxin Xre/MbcA/ParS toxin-binding domain-containing protein [Roseivirga seohaensis]KYG79968.1 hypothetical protein AWW67_11730 [Roseivirga seohaensis]
MKEQTQNSSNVLNEPAVMYGHTNYYSLADHDISKNYIKAILDISKLTLNELMAIIPISIDTYKRKTEFNPAVTEKVLEIEEVYRTGLSAFGEGFHTWMSTENVALGGVIPKKLLSNSFGVRKLLDEIGRMEHGVLA